MMLNNKAEIITYFNSVWAERPEAAIGLVIIEFLAMHIDSAKQYSIATFFDVAKQVSGQEKNAVLNVVNYLSGSDLNLLAVNVELIEDNEVFMLDDEQVVAAKNMINPRTGEIDPDIKSKLFLIFSPSDMAKKILRG